MKDLWQWRNYQVAWQVENRVNSSKVAILLIHGFGASKDHWRFNQKILGEIAPCYAIDLIGFGESSQPTSQLLYEKKLTNSFSYCFDNWSQQIVDFRNEIIKKPVILIGNSIGAVIALNALNKINNNCLSLILIDCAQRAMDDKRLAEQPIFMRFLRPIIKTSVRQRLLSESIFKNAAKFSFIEKILKIAYPSGNNVNKELIQILLQPTQRKGAPESFRGFINLFDDHLAPDLLKNSDTPVHLIWGEKDPWEPLKVAQKWVKSYECVKSLSVIENAGHCPHDEFPGKVNSILKNIIQETI